MDFMKKVRKLKMQRFNNEERQVLNDLVKNQSIQELTKESVLKDLMFSRDTTMENGNVIPEMQMQEELFSGLIQTVEAMEQAEWEEMKLLFPLPVVTDKAEDDGVL